MKLKSATRWYAVAGIGGFLLGSYIDWDSFPYLHIRTTGDAGWAAGIWLISLCLYIAGGLNFYMAVGMRFGRVDSVTGLQEAATLQSGGHIVVAACKIQFVRRLEEDDLSVELANRYVFFICSYRPWVCPQATFLTSEFHGGQGEDRS
jgi:hypothetical protein